jgi:hypothetical protein
MNASILTVPIASKKLAPLVLLEASLVRPLTTLIPPHPWLLSPADAGPEYGVLWLLLLGFEYTSEEPVPVDWLLVGAW